MSGLEGVADRDPELFVRVLAVAIDHEFIAWDRDFDVDLVRVAFVLMAMWGLDHDTASSDPIAEMIELCSFRADSLF